MSRQYKKGKAWKRQFYFWSRLLHIYISAGLFALLIFFSVTGYFLNHLDTFSGEAHDDSIELALDEQILGDYQNNLDHIDTEKILSWLRSNHGLEKVNAFEYDADLAEIFIDYDLPAGYASVVVDLAQSKVVLDYRRGDILAISNDLHKGRHTGSAWSWVIDLSALFIVFFAVTGFILIFQNKKQRRQALLVSAVGVATPIVLYFLFVPRLLGV
jgi:hypothetical protein